MYGSMGEIEVAILVFATDVQIRLSRYTPDVRLLGMLEPMMGTTGPSIGVILHGVCRIGPEMAAARSYVLAISGAAFNGRSGRQVTR